MDSAIFWRWQVLDLIISEGGKFRTRFFYFWILAQKRTEEDVNLNAKRVGEDVNNGQKRPMNVSRKNPGKAMELKQKKPEKILEITQKNPGEVAEVNQNKPREDDNLSKEVTRKAVKLNYSSFSSNSDLGLQQLRKLLPGAGGWGCSVEVLCIVVFWSCSV